ncbi:unnamed protein product [Calypogeia fissa]
MASAFNWMFIRVQEQRISGNVYTKHISRLVTPKRPKK